MAGSTSPIAVKRVSASRSGGVLAIIARSHARTSPAASGYTRSSRPIAYRLRLQDGKDKHTVNGWKRHYTLLLLLELDRNIQDYLRWSIAINRKEWRKYG